VNSVGEGLRAEKDTKGGYIVAAIIRKKSFSSFFSDNVVKSSPSLPLPLSLSLSLSRLSRQKYAKPLARCQSKRLAFRTLNWTKPQPSLARARHSASVAICRKKNMNHFSQKARECVQVEDSMRGKGKKELSTWSHSKILDEGA